MNKAKKVQYFDTLAAASAAMNIPLWRIRQAKAGAAAGIVGNRVYPAKLRPWLKANKPKTSKPLKSKADHVEGASAALRRLERVEVDSYKALQATMSTGDVNAADHHRKSWLAVSEQLRRADVALEEHRRDAGELTPRAEVEKVLENAAYWLTIGTQEIFTALCRAVGDRLDAATLTGIRNALQSHVRVASALAAGCSPALPGWAIQAFAKGATHYLVGDAPEKFVSTVQELRLGLGGHFSKDLERYTRAAKADHEKFWQRPAPATAEAQAPAATAPEAQAQPPATETK